MRRLAKAVRGRCCPAAAWPPSVLPSLLGSWAPWGVISRATLVVGALLVVLAWPAVARARGKLVDFHGAALAGPVIGGGAAGAADIFRRTQGVGFGIELGARILVIDLSIRFLQTTGASGIQGTLSSALIGPSLEFPVKGGGYDLGGKPRPPLIVIRPALAAGVGFGTPSPVDPPLSDAQIAGKGLMIVGRFAVERMFGPVFAVGGEVQGGYHYFIGASGEINGNDHSDGWQLGIFGTVAFHLGI
jgi:hypothetical protein